MGRLGGQLVEVAALRLVQGIRDAVQLPGSAVGTGRKAVFLDKRTGETAFAELVGNTNYATWKAKASSLSCKRLISSVVSWTSAICAGFFALNAQPTAR